MSRPYKQCGCGACYTRSAWRDLHLVASHWEGLELRDCVACNSTIAVRVSERPAAPREVSL